MTTSSTSEIFRLVACDVKVPSVVPCYCVVLLCQMLQAYFLNRLQRKVTIFLDFTLDHEPQNSGNRRFWTLLRVNTLARH
jgi:hypothetical protein